MPETKTVLLPMAQLCRRTAELLQESVENNCKSCPSHISELNRDMLSELAELERKLAQGSISGAVLRVAHALGECVTRAFCVALLLPTQLPYLPLLTEELACNAALSCFPEQLLTTLSGLDRFPFYSLHLCANKGRGVHALLINNYIVGEGKHLLPLAEALEAHRNVLERACGILIEENEK